MKNKLVSLVNIAKAFRKGNNTVSIFQDLNLDIAEGEFIAIMGPSGSGKTTLLNLIGGIDFPTSGNVTFSGDAINKLSESKLSKWRSRNVGIIFQSYNLMPMLSALKNVELPLFLTKLSSSERKRRALTALQLVNLSDRAKHLPSELSGGQQQRVAIARAIVADPKLLLCDEPTGDLDRETADEVLEILEMLNSAHGKTIVMVTHDEKAAKYARKVLRLDKGEFLEKAVIES